MPEPIVTKPAQRLLRLIMLASLGAVLVLLTVSAAVGIGSTRAQVLLTFVAVVIGVGLARIQLSLAGRFSKILILGLTAIVASQICFAILVWTGWRTESLAWRIWWIAMVPSVAATHVLLLLRGRRERGDWLCNVTLVLTVLAAVDFFVLGFRYHLMANIGPVLLLLGSIPASGSVIGSLIVWIRHVRARPGSVRLRLGGKIAIIATSHVIVLAGGLYVGRRTAMREHSLEQFPSAIANLSREEIDRQLTTDLARLKTVAVGLSDLEGKMRAFTDEVAKRMKAENREYYLPDEDEKFRWYFVTYLSYRSALLRLMATYCGFQAVRDPAVRDRCFIVGHAATAITYEAGLKLVIAYGDKEAERRKLNEGEPTWGISAGMFDRIREDVAGRRNIELCDEMSAYFEQNRRSWREAGVFPSGDFDWLESRALAAGKYIRQNRPARHHMQFDLFLDRVKEDAYDPVYAVQSMVSQWLGDVRIVQREPFISVAKIEEIRPLLKPGDIIVERRNWFLSNAFLPGFWPHAVLYVGNIDDLKRLGIADDDAVKAHMAEYLKLDADGQPHTLIEAVGEGVVFTSLAHSLNADYIAVLRPRLTDKQKGEAIAKAFRHVGKPYDFDFDFFTSDKLVCSELVYRAYEGMLHFPLKRIMGRDTLPPVEIVRKFADERGKAKQELDFVLFLDAVPAKGSVVEATEEELCNSVDRPRSFNE